ncbi:MAG: AraC family transcriptional regulator [Oscillospiraceae bacterium]|nr:AraC family transcriptional regulator [Oscillospiraceae bacterium]
MKLRILNDQREEIEGLYNEYPYAFHHVDLSKTTIPWHWHEELEFCYVQSGSVKVATAGQSQTFQKGEGFYINGNVLTSMTDAADCVIDSHLFHPVFLGGHFKSVFETKYLNPVTRNRNLDMLPIRGETQAQKQLLQKLRQLSQLQSQQDVELQTRNLLSEIWLLLLEELKNTQLKLSPAKNQDRILTMLTFIQENYARKLTLQEIADASAVSTRECLRCFRMSIRQSPMEYLVEYRIQAAAKLLETTNLSVTEIAMRTGWGSNSYFTKMFRRICGKTPNAHRKEYLALQKQALVK